jgi:hypothetical protein
MNLDFALCALFVIVVIAIGAFVVIFAAASAIHVAEWVWFNRRFK